MQEIRTAAPDLNVEILGINNASDQASSSLVTSSSRLPWLQDTVTNHVWSNWRAIPRDVRILDARNRVRTVYSLNLHDLSVTSNRTALKALFLKVATATDTDQDGLLDDWEEAHWGHLAAKPGEDPDRDGADNATEFAFGSNPTHADSQPFPLTLLLRGGTAPVFDLTFRRQAGSTLTYVVEGATDLGASIGEPSWTEPVGSLVNRFDGTGMATATLRVTPPPGNLALGFLRLRAQNRR